MGQVRFRARAIWLLLCVMVGSLVIGLALAALLEQMYRTQTHLPVAYYYITLEFLPPSARVVILFALGLIPIVVAVMQVNRALGSSRSLPEGR